MRRKTRSREENEEGNQKHSTLRRSTSQQRGGPTPQWTSKEGILWPRVRYDVGPLRQGVAGVFQKL